MVWFWPVIGGGRDNCLPLVTAIRILIAAALSATMSCFFSCFRVASRDDSPTSDGSHYPSISSHEAAVPCNWSQFSSLFTFDEKENQHGVEAREKVKHDKVIPAHDLDITELKDQAKFLKACGALLDIPFDIKIFSKDCGDSSSSDVPFDNHNLVLQPHQPVTPSKIHDEFAEGSVSATALTPISSCRNDGEKSIEINANQSDGYINPLVSPATLPSSTRINKSVRFEVDSYPSVSAKAFSSKFGRLKSHFSPFPTPLKLTDDMQTPGTIFPARANSMANGKVSNVRYQYVVSTRNLADEESQMKELVDNGSTSNENSTSMEINLNSGIDREITTSKKELKLETSQPSWQKPPFNQEDNNDLHSGGIVRLSGTPGDGSPILGMVSSAHWYDNDTSNVSPEWQGINGIPNTTTKYNEDQKITWHSTPFEERLEKALYDETLVLRRKQLSGGGGQPISLSENEGS
ncbi:unnamed protein product [Cuscuta epithymum]|uniref:Protein JASON-like n=1 Tax=Cuscuta epithymum TaxID=186058 RepID=A0AAV0E1Y4_9ASTE|nr:unnamed protein product [Cuscuta epithymum]